MRVAAWRCGCHDPADSSSTSTPSNVTHPAAGRRPDCGPGPQLMPGSVQTRSAHPYVWRACYGATHTNSINGCRGAAASTPPAWRLHAIRCLPVGGRPHCHGLENQNHALETHLFHKFGHCPSKILGMCRFARDTDRDCPSRDWRQRA